MSQQQSGVQVQPDVNYYAHQQQSSAFHGLNQQPTIHGVHKPVWNNPANHLQCYDDPTTNAQQQYTSSFHQNHPVFHNSSLGQNNIQFNPINSQQIGQQQYKNAVKKKSNCILQWTE